MDAVNKKGLGSFWTLPKLKCGEGYPKLYGPFMPKIDTTSS